MILYTGIPTSVGQSCVGNVWYNPYWAQCWVKLVWNYWQTNCLKTWSVSLFLLDMSLSSSSLCETDSFYAFSLLAQKKKERADNAFYILFRSSATVPTFYNALWCISRVLRLHPATCSGQFYYDGEGRRWDRSWYWSLRPAFFHQIQVQMRPVSETIEL